MLILPGNPLFDETLGHAIPPGWRDYNPVEGEVAFVVDAETQLMRPATRQELIEYVYGGEYDELEEIRGDEEE